MNILMIEGAPGVARFVERGLTTEGWTVTRVPNPNAALARMAVAPDDLVLFDIETADVDDLSFLERAQNAFPFVPILVLLPRLAQPAAFTSAMVAILHKPFAFDDLIARVDVMCAQTGADTGNDLLVAGKIFLDLSARQLCTGSSKIGLTARETTLLQILMQHPGRAYATEHLARDLDLPLDNTIDCPVFTLIEAVRQKLGTDANCIRTVKHYGYRFDAVD